MEQILKIYSENILKPALHRSLNTEYLDFQLQKILYSSKNKETINLIIDLLQSDSDILEHTRLYLSFNKCIVQKFINTPRCFRCQGLGHIAKQCEKGEICAKCAGPHITKDCASKVKRSINCLNLNKEELSTGKQINFDHYAYDGCCMAYRRFQRQCLVQKQQK